LEDKLLEIPVNILVQKTYHYYLMS
jgi:hypothetical protein